MSQQTDFIPKTIAVLLGAMLLASAAVSALRTEEAKIPDVFAHADTSVASGQTVGWLLVAGGDAQVAGTVADGIVVVDGNVTVAAGGAVAGRIVVLGGQGSMEAGADVAQPPWMLASRGHPLVPTVIAAFFLAGTATLVLAPVLFWAAGRYCRKTRWYGRLLTRLAAFEAHRPVLSLAVGLGVSALMLTAFVELAWETMFRSAMSLFDDVFVWLIRYFSSPGLDKVMIVISDMGYSKGYLVLVATVTSLIAWRKRWREAGMLAVCLIGGALLSFLLKNLFQRARPDLWQVVAASGYSFPSGHAMVSLCFYGMAAFLVMREISSWRWRMAVLMLAAVVSLAIGISRIYLGVHYPSDVLAGYAAGSTWLAFCVSFLLWWEQRRTR